MADPSSPKPAKAQQLSIQLDDETAQGAYCNLMMVNHSESEFVLDFIFLQPAVPKAKVRSRIIVSPKHAKRLLLALQDNLARYEKRHGSIELQPAKEPVGGHFH